jgi:hypothetical protein
MKKQQTRPMGRRAAMIAASEFALFHYPTMFTAARPQRLALQTAELWIVPMILTHPTDCTIGPVGFIAIEASTGKIVGSTSRADVYSRCRQTTSRGERTSLETARSHSASMAGPRRKPKVLDINQLAAAITEAVTGEPVGPAPEEKARERPGSRGAGTQG